MILFKQGDGNKRPMPSVKIFAVENLNINLHKNT